MEMQEMVVLLIAAGLVLWQLLGGEAGWVWWLVRALAQGSLLAVMYILLPWGYINYGLRQTILLVWAAVAAFSAWRMRRRRFFALPHGWRWSFPFASVLLLALALSPLQKAAAAFQAPPEALDLAFPLRNSDFYVAQGGSHISVNEHLKVAAPGREAQRGQSYALDIIKFDTAYSRVDASLSPYNPWAYKIFANPVFAPCSGKVMAAENEQPDNAPGEVNAAILEPLPANPVVFAGNPPEGGNYLLIECRPDAYVLLAHLQRGSLRVRAGEILQTGDFIARIGNSGASTEPHLHIHAQDAPGGPGGLLDANPLPIRFEGRTLRRNDVLSR